MPSKLAEFFASGVRVMQHGCNAEVSDWVRRAGSGHVLDDLTESSLERAAGLIASAPADPTMLERARAVTASHFSLASGIERYRRLLDRLG